MRDCKARGFWKKPGKKKKSSKLFHKGNQGQNTKARPD